MWGRATITLSKTDMTYAIFDEDGVMVSQLFATKEDAAQALQMYLTQ